MTVYRRYLRHSQFERIRHSDELLAFFEEQANRLTGTGSETTVTFTNATNIVNLADHGFVIGEGPFTLSNSGGALPTGVEAGTLYWVNVIDSGTFTLHLTEDDAIEGTNVVSFTDDGTGTNSVSKAAESLDIFLAMEGGKTAEQIRTLTTIDNL